MSIKLKIYQILVNRIPGICYRYHQMREQVTGIGRVKAWLYLLCLNVGWYLFRIKRIHTIPQFPIYEEKRLCLEKPESAISKRESPDELAEELMKYDVISFDVFDTLILRPFSNPTDVFYLVGERLNYLDFERIRREIEGKARIEKYKGQGTYEITIDELYEMLSSETGIDKEEGMQTEINTEYEICFANPYMSEVVKELRKKGKRLIIVSDMYLSSQHIQKLLEMKGLGTFDAYYLSSDYGFSKSDGKLYQEMMKQEKTSNIAHVGDNQYSDIEMAKKNGIDTYLYVNVNAVGNPYRPMDMSVITGSLYRGIVNAHLHNGLYEYSWDYEYGYIYGGLFAVGYCQFIHNYIEQQKLTKPIARVLFLARDGDILKQVYERMYPEEIGNTGYAYWSRLIATKLAARRYKYDYFRRMLYHKVNQDYTLDEVFETMELSDIIPEQFQGKTLTDSNVEEVKQWLNEHWEEILSHYEEESIAAKQYYSELLEGCNRVVAVDIGWAGSGAVTLDYMVNHIWNLNCEVVGLIAGTNTCHNGEPNMSESQLRGGKLVSYLYSQEFNRDLWKYHNPNKGDNLYWERLLSSPEPSVRGFCFDENGRWKVRYKQPTSAKEDSDNFPREIQRGILDFLEDFQRLGKVNGDYPQISGRDAYAPMLVAGSYDRKYLKLLKTFEEREANI
ncbi:MAG: HAD-IA family hydrolase [Lachnospiraceae bacterium]|nr:HAD-IA family hydrolase [Lachnospiraceae bacterium]